MLKKILSMVSFVAGLTAALALMTLLSLSQKNIVAQNCDSDGDRNCHHSRPAVTDSNDSSQVASDGIRTDKNSDNTVDPD